MEHHDTDEDEAAPLLQHANDPQDQDQHQHEDDLRLHHPSFAVTKAFYSFFREWMFLLLTFSIALFFIPLSPVFTLHSTSASVLNITHHKHLFTADLAVELLLDESNSLGISIYYDDSFHASLFHHQENHSTFSLTQQQESIKLEFRNVSLELDEWSINTPLCGYVYLDLQLSAEARHTQPLWPVERETTIQSYCGGVKFELCASSIVNTTTTVSNVRCDVQSDAVVDKIRLLVLLVLILLLVAFVAVLFIIRSILIHVS